MKLVISIKETNKHSMNKPLLIVVPMAGRGRRFANADYKNPKPLIPIHGVPMIRLVIESLRPTTPHRFLFICQRSHVQNYGLAPLFSEWQHLRVKGESPPISKGGTCSSFKSWQWGKPQRGGAVGKLIT